MTNLRAQSIQALIVKREIIQENQLKMIENAGGQDTLFFYELLIHSQKSKVVDLEYPYLLCSCYRFRYKYDIEEILP